MLTIGFMSLLANYRATVISDIEEVQTLQPSRTKHLEAMKSVVTTSDWSTNISCREKLEKQFKGLMDDYTSSLEEDSFAEETLVKAHLRRLRNFYIVVMEVYGRDHKLLPW